MLTTEEFQENLLLVLRDMLEELKRLAPGLRNERFFDLSGEPPVITQDEFAPLGFADVLGAMKPASPEDPEWKPILDAAKESGPPEKPKQSNR